MNAASIILVILSHAGFWIGGGEQTAELRWAVKGGLPDALVQWDLSTANTKLASGTAKLPAQESTKVTIAVPAVRAPVDMIFTCRVVDAADNKRLLVETSSTVHVFPDDLQPLKTLSAAAPILVVDGDDGLPALFARAGGTVSQLPEMSGLQSRAERIIIIGEGRYEAAHAAVLMALAESGASVVVLRQPNVPRVLQYEVTNRDTTGFSLMAEHPLLRHLSGDAWRTLVESDAPSPTISLPANEAALEIVHSPVEVTSDAPTPLDVLLMSRTVGGGRLVLCQLPVNAAALDARQRQLLINLIEYAHGRAQPTPPRTQRLKPASIERQPPDNLIGTPK